MGGWQGDRSGDSDLDLSLFQTRTPGLCLGGRGPRLKAQARPAGFGMNYTL